MSDQELLERITLNPKVMAGKPVIRGTRLTVKYVLNLLRTRGDERRNPERVRRAHPGRHPSLLPVRREVAGGHRIYAADGRGRVGCASSWTSAPGPKVAEWLRGQGHEVFSVFEEARGAEDDEVISKAYAERLDTDHERLRISARRCTESDARTGASFSCASETSAPRNKIEVLRRLLDGIRRQTCRPVRRGHGRDGCVLRGRKSTQARRHCLL